MADEPRIKELAEMLNNLRKLQKMASVQEMAIFVLLTRVMGMPDAAADKILNMEPVNGYDHERAA